MTNKKTFKPGLYSVEFDNGNQDEIIIKSFEDYQKAAKVYDFITFWEPLIKPPHKPFAKSKKPASSASKKSKTYSKTHRSKKALQNHIFRLKKRKAKIKINGMKLTYTFN